MIKIELEVPDEYEPYIIKYWNGVEALEKEMTEELKNKIASKEGFKARIDKETEIKDELKAK